MGAHCSTSTYGGIGNQPAIDSETSSTSCFPNFIRSAANHIPFTKKNRHTRVVVRPFRDLLKNWTSEDILRLYHELDAQRIVRQLYKDSVKARPKVQSFGQQMYNSSSHNIKLRIRDKEYPVHRDFFCARCENLIPFTAGAQNGEVVDIAPVSTFDNNQIEKFIRFVYTEDWDGPIDVLCAFKEQWGCERSLNEDMARLWEHIFSGGAADFTFRLRDPPPRSDDQPTTPRLTVEYHTHCHSEIMAARSPLFRCIIKKGGSEAIVDESLVPRGFARVIMHFIYTDQLNFDVLDDISSQTSLRDIEAIRFGRVPHSRLNRALQLVNIAKFFDLPRLVQLCEDVILEELNLENVVSLLDWAIQEKNNYILSNCFYYLLDNFTEVGLSHIVFEMPREVIFRCVTNQFVQATEADILSTILKWGEHELLKQMEIREPNIVAETNHSVSRRVVPRKELNLAELRDILNPILRCVRTDYVLPPFHPTLIDTYNRELLDRSPLRVSLIASSTGDLNPDSHWFKCTDDTPGPRYFEPYFKLVFSALPVYESQLREETMEDSSTGSLPFELVNINTVMLAPEHFESLRMRFKSEINRLDEHYGIRHFPRLYHKVSAGGWILKRLLIEESLLPEYVALEYDGLNCDQVLRNTSDHFGDVYLSNNADEDLYVTHFNENN